MDKAQVLSSSTHFPITHFLSYKNLSSRFKAFSSSICNQLEPSTYKKAIKDHNWCEAMQLKLLAIEQTLVIIDLSTGKNAIDCKYVCKIKYHSDGTIERYKAQLVVKVYTKQEGIDYHNTFLQLLGYSKVLTIHISDLGLVFNTI